MWYSFRGIIMKVVCENCGKEFHRQQSKLLNSNHCYCSRNCYVEHRFYVLGYEKKDMSHLRKIKRLSILRSLIKNEKRN